MYIPSHYNVEDVGSAIAFMQKFNFGILVSNGATQPEGTHLPFTVKRVADDIILTAHLAKANDHWKLFEQHRSLVIFTEPHAYISPKFYNKKQNVPTWNYLAVHAYGQIEIVDDAAGKIEILEEMMDYLEPAYKDQWRSLSDEYKSGMLHGIVAFKMIVSELQFKEKLSQNKKEEERQRIIDSFAKSTDENEKIIAEYMRK